MCDWRSGSLREHRPGVWEMRIAIGSHPITGRAIQRSFTFQDDRDTAAAQWAELAVDFAMTFGVAELIGAVSQFMALRPVDLVNTGTQARVASASRTRSRTLRPGDAVDPEIDGLGRQHQTLGQA